MIDLNKLQFNVRNLEFKLRQLEKNWLEGRKPSMNGVTAQVLRDQLEGIKSKYRTLELEITLLNQKITDYE